MCAAYNMNEVELSVVNVAEKFSAVVAVYLYGSICTDRHGPLSDIDVAVMVTSSADAAVVCGDIQDELCRRLKTDKIDLVSLAKAPATLAYRIIKDGRCIYCSDKKAVESFESLTIMKYLDFKPVREYAFKISREKTLEVA